MTTPPRDPGPVGAGQACDSWVYLGRIAGQTRTIALGTGAVLVPLARPRPGAAGDSPTGFPGVGVDFEGCDALFRENLRVIRALLACESAAVRSAVDATAWKAARR